MMRELKILAVVVIITGITYIGIEPVAHAIMHPHTEPAEYGFNDLNELKDDKNNTLAKGDIAKGKAIVDQQCKICHTVKVDGYDHIATKAELEEKYGKASDVDHNFQKLHDGWLSARVNGAVPLDLSNVATIFNEKFLKNFIKNPSNASFDSTYELHKRKQMHLDIAKLNNKDEQAKLEATVEAEIQSFKNKSKIAMYGFDFLGDPAINDIVAYLKSIAKPLTGKESIELACARCHGVQYAGIEATTSPALLKEYLGTTPPDLSMMIQSKGANYLTVFINDPQKVLIGSSMPRVGINEVTETKIVDYLASVGDSKKEERESLGLWVLGFMVIFSILAYLYKREVFRDIH